MAFRKKQRIVIERFDPDIAFIQECEHPDRFNEKLFPFYIWEGENKNKGIAAFSKNKIIQIDRKSPSRFYIPFILKGTAFIGIWAMNDKENPKNRYIAQVWNILKEYTELFDMDIIILGDFNWEITWDEKRSKSLTGDFQKVNSLLMDNNIVSGYHNHFKEDFGKEKNQTYFMQKNQNKKYHTDYIFLKKNIIDNITNFYVGQYNEWIEYSDHMPLFIEIGKYNNHEVPNLRRYNL